MDKKRLTEIKADLRKLRDKIEDYLDNMEMEDGPDEPTKKGKEKED